jgi:circadian clock protein KaiC
MLQESRERTAESLRQQEIARKRREIERERQALEAQITSLRATLEAKAAQFKLEIAQDSLRETNLAEVQLGIAQNRMADPGNGSVTGPTQRSNGRHT